MSNILTCEDTGGLNALDAAGCRTASTKNEKERRKTGSEVR